MTAGAIANLRFRLGTAKNAFLGARPDPTAYRPESVLAESFLLSSLEAVVADPIHESLASQSNRSSRRRSTC